MLNHIVIQGRMVRDPELRRTGSGVAVAGFTVACERDFAQDGKKETDFIDCVAWRQTGEFVSKYFRKGSMIVVSGRLQIRKWEDKNGNKRSSAEIVADNCYFGESKRDSDSAGSSYGGRTGESSYGSGYGSAYPETQAQIDRVSGHGFTAPPYPGTGYQQQDFAMIEDDDAQMPF